MLFHILNVRWGQLLQEVSMHATLVLIAWDMGSQPGLNTLTEETKHYIPAWQKIRTAVISGHLLSKISYSQ